MTGMRIMSGSSPSASAGVHVGIKELVLKGCMTVTLRPLIPQIPVAGAVTVSFANTPTLDFNFSGPSAPQQPPPPPPASTLRRW